MYVVQFQNLRGLYKYANEALLLRRHTFTGTRASQREVLLHGAHTTQEQPAAAAAPGETTAATPPGGTTAAALPRGPTAAAAPPGETTAACAL